MKLRLRVETLRSLQEKFKSQFWSHGLISDREKLPKDTVLPVDMGRHLDLATLKDMHAILTEFGESNRHLIARVIAGLENPTEQPVADVRYLPDMMASYLSSQGNPILYDTVDTSKGATYLPLSCTYEDPRRGNDEKARVCLTLAYIVNGRFQTRPFWLENYAKGNTVPAILAACGLIVPDEKLIGLQEKIMDRFNRYLEKDKAQFRAVGKVSAKSDRYWWNYHSIDLMVAGKPSKVILDLGDRDSDDDMPFASKLNKVAESELYGGKRFKVPVHPVLPVFSLAHHKDVWLNVCNMVPYKYEDDLIDKLVLPKSHTRLIDALVSNLDLLSQDHEDAAGKSAIMGAKAQSSIILAMGPPGTGKTLTAEVYAEKINRPLYEVQSGQLGTDPEEIEERLNEILQRSTRLEAPLLINEADVFVQKRGKDLVQAAVVAVFLRLLEYHNGLVFLTTNRPDDVDDAILSRCIAQIAYDIPDRDDRRRLWSITLAEFGASLTDKEMNLVADVFPTIVGRDIQNLIRLTSRVCAASNTPFSLESLKENAVFRGIAVKEHPSK